MVAAAWPFQENALALSKMRLLWREEPDSWFEADSQTEPEFGEYDRESRSFCEEATLFCLEILHAIRTPAGLQKEEFETMFMAMAVLETIEGSTHNPRGGLEGLIVASIKGKAITEYWDRLAIIGNCCRYGTRLEPLSLRDGDHSVSLYVLAMCLLNGEVLDNWKTKPA